MRKRNKRTCLGGSTAFTVALLGCVLVVAGLLASAPAAAGTAGQLCIKEKIGGNPPCTANDVRVGRLALVGAPTSCTPGQPVTALIEATIESGPDRWAIGLWINETGGSAQTDPGGTCYRDFLTPVDSSTNNDGCNQLGGPYFDGDADACGDVFAQNTDPCGTSSTAPCSDGGGTCLFTTYQFTSTFECTDANDDGIADVGTCTRSWDNQVVGTCTSELDTDPGTGSKCSCDTINIGDLFFGCQADSDCDDQVDCTDDVCTIENSVGTCTNEPNDSVCNPTGNVCTVGVCDAVDDCQIEPDPAAPPQCDSGSCVPSLCNLDGNFCTEGACDDATGECFPEIPIADSTPCEDGNICTSETGAPQTPDHCFSGVCTGVPVDCSGDDDQCNDGVCNDSTGACEAIPVANSTPCEDGSYCTSFGSVPGDADHCFDGTCTGTPVDCGDGDDCNTNECNETSDACEFVPVANSTPCEDGSYCTSFGSVPGDADHCFDGTCTGTPVDCGDGDDCNTNECNETSDACEFVPVANSTPCEDGSYCTSFGSVPGDADHCFDGTCTGTPVNCGDGDDCNTNECNEASDACVFVPVANSTPCEDGSYCTSFGSVPGDADHCFDGTCTGTPVDCGNGDDCNTNECNETSDACEFVPVANSTPCEDGSYCTSFGSVPGDADHCFDGTCTGTPVDCGDGDDCNTNECNETSDACEFVPVANSTPCEDGDFCTSETGEAQTPDHCFGGVCTGIPVDCSAEDDQCNTGVCDVATGACVDDPLPDSTPCQDGFYCTSFGGVPGDADHCETGDCTGVPVECPEPTSQCNSGAICDETNDLCDEGTFDWTLCKDPCSGDGKQLPPTELEFLYVNTAGDASFDEVCVIVTHHRGDVWELANVTDYFSFSRAKRLQPKIEIEICSDETCADTSTCAEPIKIHTSCSLPLNIGDLFGPNNELELTGEVFASEPAPAPVRTSRESR